MLVLSRKQDQEIVIGDNITIKILKVKGNTIRIGIDAPKDVRVVRGELPARPTIQSAGNSAEAEFTVVFSNDTEPRDPSSELIPFPAAAESQRSNKNRTAVDSWRESTANAQVEGENGNAAQSVSFRGTLPESLRHNRLKQLVKELTRDQKSQ